MIAMVMVIAACTDKTHITQEELAKGVWISKGFMKEGKLLPTPNLRVILAFDDNGNCMMSSVTNGEQSANTPMLAYHIEDNKIICEYMYQRLVIQILNRTDEYMDVDFSGYGYMRFEHKIEEN